MNVLFAIFMGVTALSGLGGEAFPAVGLTASGFRVVSVKDVPDAQGRLWRMEYVKNGADLVWLDRADDNRTFAIAFKTIPSDDTGVAHIMEHSVLNGSRKFPVKEPFVELLKSSLSTYLNAWTSPDCTTYPFATKNGQDYLNLMDVYLDAVFHPLSMQDDWSMRQEGWHYEFDGTNLTRNGVVYSEMKGVFGNPSRIARTELHRLLFPDNTYGKVSGGDPVHIPELTYEKYRAFHRRFYHPSNARIFLYGSIDLAATLTMLDAYLKDYDRQAVDAVVPRQRATTGRRMVPYECREDGDRTILSDGWIFGTFADREQNLAMDVLCEYLAGSNEAPLKKALLDANLCKDLSLGFGGSEQTGLYLEVKNTSEAKAAACRRLVRETVGRLCGAGLDAVRLGAILDRMEFACRENDSSQRGLRYLGLVLDGWLYGGDPSAGLETSSLYAAVRARLGTGWFEDVLKRAVLDNPHHAEVTLVPSKTLADERRRDSADELRRIKEIMTPDQLERTVLEARALRERQSRPDAPESLATLPRLSLKDIPLRGFVPEATVTNVGATTVIRSSAAAGGIVYLDLCFALSELSDDELLDVPFLATVLGELATRRFAPLQLKSELDGKLGDFSVSVHSYAKGPQLVAHVSALETRQEEALALLREVLLETRYDDAEAIANLRTQRRESLERTARANGGGLADCRARRSLSESNRIADLFSGVAQLRRMQEPMRNDLKALSKRIFSRSLLTLCVSGKVGDAYLRRLADAWPVGGPVAASRESKPLTPVASEGYATAGQVGYLTLAGQLPEDVPYAGAQVVAARIVTLEHLWNEVRLKGGAYGGSLSVNSQGNVAYSSWRDPNPARTLGQFRRSASVLEDFVTSGKSFESYQISSIKSTEPNFSPREEADFARRQYFSGRKPEDLQRLRREILETTSADLLSFAKTLSGLTEGASACVFANEKLLEPCKLKKVEQIAR